jgi:hypothetical protein
MLTFLGDVWAPHTGGYVFLAAKMPDTGKWQESAIRILSIRRETGRFLERFSRWGYDLYFCPNAFNKPKRLAGSALPTRLGWCDIDEADPDQFRPAPNLVWKTSPRRSQGLWLWNRSYTPQEAETFSRALAYRFGGDHNGWSITKMLRLPGSINHKPAYRKPAVKLVKADLSPQHSRPVLKGDYGERRVRPNTPTRISRALQPDRHDWKDVLGRYRSKLHLRVLLLARNTKVYERDRSKCIFEIVAGLHGAGAAADEIAAVLWRSPYFISKHGESLRALSAEINRIISKLGRAP